MHGKSDNDIYVEQDNDMHVEHCNDMHVKPDNNMHAELGNDVATMLARDSSVLHRPIKSDPSYTKNPARTCEPGFPSQKG